MEPRLVSSPNPCFSHCKSVGTRRCGRWGLHFQHSKNVLVLPTQTRGVPRKPLFTPGCTWMPMRLLPLPQRDFSSKLKISFLELPERPVFQEETGNGLSTPHTYTRMHTYTYKHTYTYTHIHTCRYIHTYTHVDTHTDTHSQVAQQPRALAQSVFGICSKRGHIIPPSEKEEEIKCGRRP